MVVVFGVIAASYGLVMAVSPVLQIRQMLQTRSSADVSLAYLGLLTVGFLVWLAYGLALQNLALVIPNSVAFVVAAATIVVALRLRR